MAGARARLEVLTGKAAGMSIVIDDELVIGRLSEGAGRLADDDEISRSHARLSVDARGLCTVEDLGSTNGTWVNGMRIATPQPLSEGDTLELGGTTMVVREVPEVEQSAAPPAPVSATSPVQKTVVPGVPTPAAEAAPAASEVPPLDVAAPAAEAPEFDAPTAPVAPAPEISHETEDAAEAAEQAPPALALRLHVDFGAREVQIELDDHTEPVRLVFDGDSWRTAPDPSIEKGDPA